MRAPAESWELLVQIVHNAIAAKRRMLIFSQFVGMLEMIRKRLGREGVQTLYLDGETRPDKRQELCDRFNGGEGRAFLISLKAGGTGLNLTGADLVIHYDPMVEPRRRGPGDRPCAPHRPEA